MKILNKLSFILLYIMGFLIIGLGSAISGDVGFGVFNDTIYYIKTLLTYVAIICITLATVYSVIDKFKETDTEYINCETEIKVFAKELYIPSIFTKFLHPLNFKRKTAQHIYKTRKKLHKLEAFTQLKENLFNRRFNHKSYFERNTYIKKKSLLEYKLSDEYISNQLPKKFVRYDKISSSIILSGFYDKNENSSPNEFVHKYKTAKIILDKIPNFILSIGITTFMSALIIDFKFDASVIIDLITKILVLCWNTYIAFRYANTYVQQITLTDIRFRKGIVSEYKKWVKQEYEEKKKLLQEDEHSIAQIRNNNLLTEVVEDESIGGKQNANTIRTNDY